MNTVRRDDGTVRRSGKDSRRTTRHGEGCTVDDVEIALVNVQGTFYAIDNECTHRGGSLGDGEINTDWSEWAIECPLHGSVFDVRTGDVLNPPAPAPVRTYAVELDGDVVKVSTTA